MNQTMEDAKEVEIDYDLYDALHGDQIIIIKNSKSLR